MAHRQNSEIRKYMAFLVRKGSRIITLYTGHDGSKNSHMLPEDTFFTKDRSIAEMYARMGANSGSGTPMVAEVKVIPRINAPGEYVTLDGKTYFHTQYTGDEEIVSNGPVRVKTVMLRE